MPFPPGYALLVGVGTCQYQPLVAAHHRQRCVLSTLSSPIMRIAVIQQTIPSTNDDSVT